MNNNDNRMLDNMSALRRALDEVVEQEKRHEDSIDRLQRYINSLQAELSRSEDPRADIASKTGIILAARREY